MLANEKSFEFLCNKYNLHSEFRFIMNSCQTACTQNHSEPVEKNACSLIIVECFSNLSISFVNDAATVQENDKSLQIEKWFAFALQLNLWSPSNKEKKTFFWSTRTSTAKFYSEWVSRLNHDVAFIIITNFIALQCVIQSTFKDR